MNFAAVCVLMQLACPLHGLPRPSDADLEAAAAPKYYITVVTGATLPAPRTGASTGDEQYYISVIAPSRPSLPAYADQITGFVGKLPDVIEVRCPVGLAPCGGRCCRGFTSDDSSCPNGFLSVDGQCISFDA